ncbi:helix-turn-helix domain-containing protein [Actinokineospora cianjurensis]|uniref:Excisionase family DNA binding protein n=1 Tax=Actinokineospora cianjurensis TaxID=585224 RepID=A0A421B7D7_9PSEU|nr:helix-turn-helix domain-containing protein [Actinokineospora cianjurensis]RLK60402.1 hypothetical protein CLV68_0906 [Actinokineospora cianjurensis]
MLFYSIRETAWILGAPLWRVRRAVRLGTLPAVHRRGRLMVPSHEVVRWFDAVGVRRER